MVVESPRLKLVEDLLKEGHTVYVIDIDDVIERFREELEDLYDDNIIFVRNGREINESVWTIDL